MRMYAFANEQMVSLRETGAKISSEYQQHRSKNGRLRGGCLDSTASIERTPNRFTELIKTCSRLNKTWTVVTSKGEWFHPDTFEESLALFVGDGK